MVTKNILIILEHKLLDDPLPKILFPQMPYIWFIPVHKDVQNKGYMCPVYKTSKRSGELLTSGQSMNFLINTCKYYFLNLRLAF